MTLYCDGFKKQMKEDFVYVADRTPILIPSNSEKLVIGTMISYKGRYLKGAGAPIDETFDFFYPNINKNSLWLFLKETYSLAAPLRNKEEKENYLLEYKIGMVNLIQTAFCKRDNSEDKEIVIETLKENIIILLVKSNVRAIYFTSINARKLFNLYLEENKIVNQSTDLTIFINNREYECHTLPNPTNRGRKGETKAWKIAQYKRMFLGIGS